MKTAGGWGKQRGEGGESQHEMDEVYKFLMVHPDPYQNGSNFKEWMNYTSFKPQQLDFGKSLIRDGEQTE